ncbi:DUF4191 domain-containing protein [Nakamurella antarctica]|uniref:DUF4191 domain-containing protein n=1 Tax=Nakamurella antarctica TaxID=1902245 RepID=A0A3G8ZUT4_9ACTN|nr:DUF4191 domain-containing protein [Nakamurella antarctica]AZI58254.1 DUF4191 domain-containing protein [Nakamurella antarctica]
MAKAAVSSANVKPTKVEKKAIKAAKKAAAKERRGQLWQAFQMQRKQDKNLLPIMVGILVATTGVGVGLGFLFGGGLFLVTMTIFGVFLGILVALFIFSRRVQNSVYKQADGTPGAAAWSLQNNLRGKWRITPAVAGTTHLDAVHRVIGRPGIVLIAEGSPARIIPLLAQEKRRVARIVGDAVPIYDIVVGNEDKQTPLRKLNTSLMKLPRNISAAQVEALDTRLKALAGRSAQAGIPKGPMPAGAKPRSVQRSARRR